MSDINDPNSTSSDPTDLQAALGGSDDPGVFIEKKKTAITPGNLFLGGLFLVGIAATYVMYLKAGPKSTVAATPESKAATATISQFLSEGKKDLANMQSLLADTEKVVQKFLQYPAHNQVPGADLHTNPFRFETPSVNASSSKPDETASQLQKKREEARAAARTDAAKLKLTSVLVGKSENLAFISGQQVKLGDTIETFIVESIASDSVVIRKNGFRFKLAMNK